MYGYHTTGPIESIFQSYATHRIHVRYSSILTNNVCANLNGNNVTPV